MKICMVSDFFYPNTGGIESHIFTLSQCLIKRKIKVVVVTHSYEDRVGVRYMTKGLKVYYLPMQIMADQVVLPSVHAVSSLFRQIFIRERIDIVHGHSAFSPLAHAGILIAKFMGLKAVFTDHSLMGFSDVPAILTNKLLEITLSSVDYCICVSEEGEKNTRKRAKLDIPGKARIKVIPNATDTTFFTPPDKQDLKQNPFPVTIVSVCRLVHRKGIDLLVNVIPEICKKYPNVGFIIGGDGPKRVRLEQLREQGDLGKQVKVLGALSQPKVRETLRKGHIFLNTSRTEAFCMAILEAASCGLQVVSTNVGGIPELKEKIREKLKEHGKEVAENEKILLLAEPTVKDIVSKLEIAIEDCEIRNGGENREASIHPSPAEHHDERTEEALKWEEECHDTIKKTFKWEEVAKDTVNIYMQVKEMPRTTTRKLFTNYMDCGLLAGLFFVSVFAMHKLILFIYDWLIPENLIDEAPDLPELRKSKSRLAKKSLIEKAENNF